MALVYSIALIVLVLNLAAARARASLYMNQTAPNGKTMGNGLTGKPPFVEKRLSKARKSFSSR